MFDIRGYLTQGGSSKDLTCHVKLEISGGFRDLNSGVGEKDLSVEVPTWWKMHPTKLSDV